MVGEMMLSSSMERKVKGKNQECRIGMIDRKLLYQSSDMFVIRTASQEDKGSNTTRMSKEDKD